MSERIGAIRYNHDTKLAQAIDDVSEQMREGKINPEDVTLYAMPFTAPEVIYMPPPMDRVKQRGQSNRKRKSVSKTKRKMANASKRKNRKR